MTWLPPLHARDIFKVCSLECMPPTSQALYFHSLRVHHKSAPDNTYRGYLLKRNMDFLYIMCLWSLSSLRQISSSARKNSQCKVFLSGCQSSRRLCGSCGCSRKGLLCSIHCKCGNNLSPDITIPILLSKRNISRAAILNLVTNIYFDLLQVVTFGCHLPIKL